MANGEPETERLLIGRDIGGFRVLRRLGRGGMGEVYLAHEERLGRQVVLKFLAARWSGDPNLVKRFAREVRAAARLNHPNVVTIHSFHDVEGLIFYAMEYVEGRSLAQMIAREAPIEVGRALTIAAQAADALACAHKAGILHRDIKPSNILITPTGLVKVLDFGIAKILGEQTELTTDGTFLGTLAYASPEQCEAVELDARTDVYSLGVVLYEMLAGRPPHTADTPLTLIKRIVNDPPSDLETFNPRVPGSVKQLLARMLEKQRQLRLANGEAAAAAIRQVAGESAGKPEAAALAPTVVLAPTPPRAGEVPLGRPADRPSDRPRQRSRSIKKAIFWGIAVLFVLAVLSRLGDNAKTRQQKAASVATPTPTPATPVSTPEATPAPPAPTLTTTPRIAWPTPTPLAVAATPPPAAAPIVPATAFSALNALQAVPADRDLVMEFNIRSLLQSQLIRSNESKVFSREATQNLDAFFGSYGLDWRRDIDRVTLSGLVAKPDALCLTFVGRLNESAIVAQLRRYPAYRAAAYNDRQIHSYLAPTEGRLQCAAFLAPGIAACGSLATLQQVSDAATGRASLLSRPAVRNALAGLDGAPDFWILGIGQAGAGNPALAGLDAWVLRGRLTPDLDLVGIAWPRDVKQIEVTYNLIRLVIEAWRNDKTNADLRNLGANIAVERSADTLSLHLRVPYADLVRMLDNAAAKGNYPFR